MFNKVKNGDILTIIPKNKKFIVDIIISDYDLCRYKEKWY